MKLLILSDIHGNLSALHSVLDQITHCPVDVCILLGDLIDYGMHSNEVLDRLKSLPVPCLCNIWGNHEYEICTGDFSRFSSRRGQLCAQYTREHLNQDSWRYLRDEMEQTGKQTFLLEGKSFLAVHGGLADPYWGKLTPGDSLNGCRDYDYVFSGHSHIPHFFERLFAAEDPKRCNQLDTASGEVRYLRAAYDISKEQVAYAGQVDNFYKKRLAYGV